MKCDECNSRSVIIRHGEMYCLKCGLVKEYVEPDIIKNQFRAKTKFPIQAGGMSVRSRIFGMTQGITYTQEVMLQKRREMLQICERLKLSDDVIRECDYMFCEAHRTKITVGRDTYYLLLACVYHSAKITGTSVSTRDMCAEFVLNLKKLNHNIRLLQRKLNIQYKEPPLQDILLKYCDMFKLNCEHRTFALKLLEKVEKVNYQCGRNPATIVSSILYVVSKSYSLGISQRMLCYYIGTDDATIRKVYPHMLKAIH